MRINQIKLLIIAGFVFLLVAVIGFRTGEIFTVQSSDADVAAVYKAKCALCHTAKAEKFFDLSKTDEQHAEIILKGKKGAKPPVMPEFASKGITPEQAKALVVYMRKLRTPDSPNTNAVANVNGANTNVNVNVNSPNANANTNPNAPVNANADANVNSKPAGNTPVNANANVNVNSNAAVNKAPSGEIVTLYKTKCAMCHSPKAEKAYDPAMPLEDQIAAILKGKKTAKPPAMPGFETKGVTAEQARALAEYMKSLRTPDK